MASGRKPRYKDARDSTTRTKMDALSALDCRAPVEDERNSASSQRHPNRDDEGVRALHDGTCGSGHPALHQGDCSPPWQTSSRRISEKNFAYIGGSRTDGSGKICRETPLLSNRRALLGSGEAQEAQGSNKDTAPHGNGSSYVGPNERNGNRTNVDRRGRNSGGSGGLSQDTQNSHKYPQGDVIDPRNPIEASKMMRVLRMVAQKQLTRMGSRAWDESVSATMFNAIESAAKLEFLPLEWWAKRMVSAAIREINDSYRFIWIDADSFNHDGASTTPTIDRIGKSTPPTQETYVLAREMLDLVGKLPSQNQVAIMLRADGADVFEIAREMDVEPKKIIWLLNNGREWLDRV